jgi:hypothetical protein
MTRAIIVAAIAALSGCAAINPALTGAGVSSTIVADTNALGQLACQANGVWMLVAGANVVGAASSAVASVCAAAAPGAVPGAVPGGTVARVVTVGNDVLAVLAASKAAGL